MERPLPRNTKQSFANGFGFPASTKSRRIGQRPNFMLEATSLSVLGDERHELMYVISNKCAAPLTKK